MSGRPRVVLHIGSGKTGTTSIQQFLRDNRPALAERGVLYPRIAGKQRHTRLGLFAMPREIRVRSEDWLRGDFARPEQFERRFRRRFATEIAENAPSTVVLSDEGLFAAADATMRRLGDFLHEHTDDLRIVAYLRRQEDHLISRYQQVVKMGSTLPLADWAARTDFSRTYDYAQRLDLWQTHARANDVVVRPFERSGFVGGSLHQDFLTAAAIGIDLAGSDLIVPDHANESLGAEAVEVLRLLNLYTTEVDGLERWQIRNRPHVVRLAALDSGPVLTLPGADLDDFMGRWAESNTRLARDRLGATDGVLFRTARKGADITTVQHLPLDRAERYLALLDLPDVVRAGVLRIAAREAALPG